MAWLLTLWQGVKGLFGKGTTQIGKGNQAIAGLTIGDNASSVNVGNEIHIHQASAPLPKPTTFQPTMAEIQILLRLEASSNGYLESFSFESGSGHEVLIDGRGLGGQHGRQIGVQLLEAVDRLQANGLLTSMNGDRELLHLSSPGRKAAKDIREQINALPMPDFTEIEPHMPDLLREMKEDFASAPLIREMVICDSDGDFSNNGDVLIYHRENHPNLDSMIQMLEKHGFVNKIGTNSVERYRVNEPFARYLGRS